MGKYSCLKIITLKEGVPEGVLIRGIEPIENIGGEIVNKIPLIIDCDPGVDDILSILLAHSLEGIDLKAITSVNGNVGIDYTTRNSLLIADLLDLDCIVARGEAVPLVKPLLPKSDVHGKDGLGGYLDLFPKEIKKDLSKESAVTVLKDLILNSPEKISIAAIGPLTNIAILLKSYPEVKENIEVLSIMGGAINNGNATPCSEFNFYADPEAASVVFNSGVPIILSGLNLTLKATLTERDIDEMKNIGSEISNIALSMLKDYISKDAAIHDPCAILALTNIEMFEYEDLYVQVDTRDGVTRGMSYADYRDINKNKANCKVLTDLDVDKFREFMVNSLKV